MLGKHKTLILNKCDEKRRNLLGNISAGHWNQLLSGLMCCIGFCLIFGMMLYFTIEALRKESPGLNVNQMNTSSLLTKHEKQASCSVTMCSVTCSLYYENNFSTILEELLANSTCHDGILLTLKSLIFPHNRIMKDWLNSTVLKIQHLQFNYLTIDTIEPEAFQHTAFRKMKFFYIGHCEISHLYRGVFKGLNNLNELNIWNSNVEDIERGALIGIEHIISALNIRETKIDIQNLFTDVKFAKLSIVVLSSTQITKITRNTFNGLSSCISLYLESCNIDEIEEGSFSYMTKMVRLDLRENRLKNLSGKSFPQTSLRTLLIKDNPWHCNCYIDWMKNLNLLNDDFKETLCKEPEKAANKNFLEVDFCDLSMSTIAPPPTTAKYTDSPTTKNDDSQEESYPSTYDIPQSTPIFVENYFNMSCLQYKSDTSNEIIGNQQKTVDEEIHDIKINGIRIFEINDYKGVVIEARPTYSLNDVLIWFESRDNYTEITNYPELLKCFTYIQTKTVTIFSLMPGKTYTFCLLRNGNDHVSPFDCRSYLVPLIWRDRAWLVKKQKPLIIVIVIVMTIVSCICGAAVAYIIVRKYPILLRGSKRIVIVKNNDTKAIVLPPEDIAESKNDNIYDQVISKQNLECRRRNFKRSVSETSIISSKSASVSYISALEPTPVQLLHWRLERLRGGADYRGAHVETSPDPLPS